MKEQDVASGCFVYEQPNPSAALKIESPAYGQQEQAGSQFAVPTYTSHDR